MTMSYEGFFFLLVSLVASCNAEPKNAEKRISLADIGDVNVNGKAVYDTVNLEPNSDNVVEVYKIPDNVTFILVQAHSHENNLKISYTDETNCNATGCSSYGSNVGLYFKINRNKTASVALSHDSSEHLNTLISVSAYGENAPIPGGCNLEFETEIAPYQKVNVTTAMVQVDAEPAARPSSVGGSCGTPDVTLTMYRMYLPEYDFTSETYFDSIKKMITVENIMKNGDQIPPGVYSSSNRRVFSAYPGTGSIYAMIATYQDHSAAYVPIATYACSPLTNLESCEMLNTTISRILCPIVLIFGVLVNLFGHRTEKLRVFFSGAILGGLVTVISFDAVGSVETSIILGAALGVGILIGGLALCVELFKLLSLVSLGFLIASTIYAGIKGPMFESDVNFALVFVGVTLLVTIVLGLLPLTSVVYSAIFGAFMTVLPIDYYSKSNLKYIVINTIRRMTVPGFNLAVIQAPYQSTDKWLVATLVILIFIGIFKYIASCEKFKECCCCCEPNSTTVYWDERQPIHSQSRNGRRILVFGESNRVQTSYSFG